MNLHRLQPRWGHSEHPGSLPAEDGLVVVDRDGYLGNAKHGTRILASFLTAALISLPSPVSGEDEAPPPDFEIQQTGETTFRYGQISFDKKERTIRVPAQVCIREGILEYALVHESGKVHESLLTTGASAMRLHTALLLLGYGTSQSVLNPMLPAEEAVSGETAAERAASEIHMAVSWGAHDSGEEKTAPLESWVTRLENGTEKTAAPGPFVITGSKIYQGRFLAELDGNIAAIYLDSTALINNPRPGSEDDELWLANTAAIPPVDTRVTLILSPKK